MTWIKTSGSGMTGLWSIFDIDTLGSHSERDGRTLAHDCKWFNVETCYGYLLIVYGDAQVGGTFHLLFKAEMESSRLDVSPLLPTGSRSFNGSSGDTTPRTGGLGLSREQVRGFTPAQLQQRRGEVASPMTRAAAQRVRCGAGCTRT